MKTNVMTKCLAVLTVVALLAGQVQAIMVMEIDTANEQFRITGSDSGTAAHGDLYNAIWAIGTDSMGSETADSYEAYADLFGESFVSEVFVLESYSDTGGLVALLIIMSSTDFSSVSGSEAWVDYSTMNETLKPEFEGLIGGVMSSGLSAQSGWSDIAINAVPEPATMVIFGLGGLMLNITRRRA
jgi:hypothetical protein